MPTIVDSLIIELALDPKKFTEGQRQAIDLARNTMQGLQNIADEGDRAEIRRYNRTAARRRRQREADAADEEKASKKAAEQGWRRVDQTEEQYRRMGRRIADYGREGAAGLTNLTTAALSAYSAMKALEGLYHEVTSTAAAGAAIGRIIPETGANSVFVQQFANAANIAVNANPVAVQEDLRSLEMDLQTFARRGEMSGRLREMMIGGVNISQTDTAETLMRKVEANLAGKGSEAEAAMWGQRYGLSRDTSRFARRGVGAVDAAMQQAAGYDLTKEQIAQLERLQSAENKVTLAYQHLWQTITADFSRSGLASALEGLSSFLEYLSKNEAELHAVELGIGVVATATGVTMVSAIGKLIISLNSLWAVPAWRALIALAGVGGSGAAVLRFLGPVGAAAAVMAPSAAGNQSEIDAERRLFGQARAAAGIGGSGSLPAPGAPTGGDPRGMEPIIRAAAEKYGIDPEVAMRVARSEGLGVFLGDRGKSGGSFQLYTGGGLGNRFQQETGLNPLDPKNEPATIDWAMAHLRETGWAPYHGAARSGIANWQGIGAGRNALAALPGQHKFNSQVRDAYNQYNREHPDAMLAWPDFLRQLAAARARQSAGINNSSNINNDIDHTMNIGKVEVHTQATDANGIAGSMDNALRRKVMVNQVNTGLE